MQTPPELAPAAATRATIRSSPSPPPSLLASSSRATTTAATSLPPPTTTTPTTRTVTTPPTTAVAKASDRNGTSNLNGRADGSNAFPHTNSGQSHSHDDRRDDDDDDVLSGSETDTGSTADYSTNDSGRCRDDSQRYRMDFPHHTGEEDGDEEMRTCHQDEQPRTNDALKDNDAEAKRRPQKRSERQRRRSPTANAANGGHLTTNNDDLENGVVNDDGDERALLRRTRDGDGGDGQQSNRPRRSRRSGARARGSGGRGGGGDQHSYLDITGPSIGGVVWTRTSVLVSLLLLQSLSQFILEMYENLIAEHVIIPLFLTMLVGAGGNAGNQATVRAITGLASGEFRQHDFLRLLRKEFFVGVVSASILAFIAFGRVYYFYGSDNLFWSTVAITLSLFAIVVASVVIGTTLPFLLGAVGADREHAAPIIQVVMDITGVFLTCAICSLLIPDSEHRPHR